MGPKIHFGTLAISDMGNTQSSGVTVPTSLTLAAGGMLLPYGVLVMYVPSEGQKCAAWASPQVRL